MNPFCTSCPKRQGNVCSAVKVGKAAISSLKSCPEDRWPAQILQSTAVASTNFQDTRQVVLEGVHIAPLRHGHGRRYEGSAPWRKSLVSVILPIIEYNATLPLVLECLRRQTLKPLIYIVDTGSILTTSQIDALRDEYTEVFQIRSQGWRHSSMPVAAALDTAWACIGTPYAFFTHDDCFIKKQDALSTLVTLTEKHKVVGHRITPREYPEWVLDFGHTFLMLDVAFVDRIPLTWNMRAFEHLTGISVNPGECKLGFPDTETMMNHLIRTRLQLSPSFEAAPGQPLFLGTEENFVRNENEWFDHCRSMTCGFLYSKVHHDKAMVWAQDAMANAKKRLESWV